MGYKAWRKHARPFVPDCFDPAAWLGLPDAIAVSNRAFVFDNPGENAVWLAEITEGTQLEYRTEEIPDGFFEAYIDEVEP